MTWATLLRPEYGRRETQAVCREVARHPSQSRWVVRAGRTSLSQSCPKVIEKLPRKPRFGPNSAKTGRHRQKWQTMKKWPMLVEFGQVSPKINQVGQKLAKCWPKSACDGWIWPKVGENWPKSVEVGQILAKSGRTGQVWPIWAKVGPKSSIACRARPHVGQVWPPAAEVWPTSANLGRTGAETRLPEQLSDNCWATLVQLWDKIGARWDHLG